jgi:hypothetical protein
VEVCAAELVETSIEAWGRAEARPIRPAEKRATFIVGQTMEENVVCEEAGFILGVSYREVDCFETDEGRA